MMWPTCFSTVRELAENDGNLAVSFALTEPLHYFTFPRREPERGKVLVIDGKGVGCGARRGVPRLISLGGGVHLRGSCQNRPGLNMGSPT